MEGPVFTENNWISPVLNTCKKILGNITDKYREGGGRGGHITHYQNKVEMLKWNMVTNGGGITQTIYTVEFC